MESKRFFPTPNLDLSPFSPMTGSSLHSLASPSGDDFRSRASFCFHRSLNITCVPNPSRRCISYARPGGGKTLIMHRATSSCGRLRDYKSGFWAFNGNHLTVMYLPFDSNLSAVTLIALEQPPRVRPTQHHEATRERQMSKTKKMQREAKRGEKETKENWQEKRRKKRHRKRIKEKDEKKRQKRISKKSDKKKIQKKY